MLNLIEEKAEWPTDLEYARAVTLAKTMPPSIDDPFKYRLLLMLPALYRLWARMRLKDMEAWVATWDIPEIYAGVPGKGAEHAWYKTALDVEQAMIEGEDLSMTMFDLTKAFDHIPRKLLYRIMSQAGFPRKLLRAYEAFLENLQVFYTIADSAGPYHARRRSIPQGDPWSMMAMALFIRPWIMLAKSKGLLPRSLADDMLLAAKGPRADLRLEEGVNDTLGIIDDMN